MRVALIVALLSVPLFAEQDLSVVASVAGREVRLDTTIVGQRSIYNALVTLRASQVASLSAALVAAVLSDSMCVAALDSTGITVQVDRLDESYLRVAIPQNDRLLVAARAQWLLDGAVTAEGDTIRATLRLTQSGLRRMAAFYP